MAQPHDLDRRARAPIGVFDSGVGGLSVLQALRAALPHESFVYWADTAHAPYGERGEAFVRERSLAIAQQLTQAHQIKALVVACNTATAAAIDALRQAHPELPLIGVEPALKPAALLTRTRRVGVMATRGTLESARFQRLLAQQPAHVAFVLCPCDGLALAIEQTTQPQMAAHAAQRVTQLLAQHTARMGDVGVADGQIDTVVLGCTHYVFVQPQLQALLGQGVQWVSTGVPVAQHTRNLLAELGLLAPQEPGSGGSGQTLLLSSAPDALLHASARHWLGLASSAAGH